MKRNLLQLLAAFFLPYLLVCACQPAGPLLQLHAHFPPAVSVRSVSLLDTLAVGAAVQLTGIYDRLAAAGQDVPVIRVYDNIHGSGYAFLHEPARIHYGALVKIHGYVIHETLAIAPQQVLVKKIQTLSFQALETNKDFLIKSQKLYQYYLPQLQQYTTDNHIALQLPPEPEWRLLYDGKKQSIISYMAYGNGIYESRLEILFSSRNNQATTMNYYTFFKGE